VNVQNCTVFFDVFIHCIISLFASIAENRVGGTSGQKVSFVCVLCLWPPFGFRSPSRLCRRMGRWKLL